MSTPAAESTRINPFLSIPETTRIPPADHSSKDEGALGDHKVTRSQPLEFRAPTLDSTAFSELSILGPPASAGVKHLTSLSVIPGSEPQSSAASREFSLRDPPASPDLMDLTFLGMTPGSQPPAITKEKESLLTTPPGTAPTNPLRTFLSTSETPPTHNPAKDGGEPGDHKVTRSQSPGSRSSTPTGITSEEVPLLGPPASTVSMDQTFLSIPPDSQTDSGTSAKTPTTLIGPDGDRIEDDFVWVDEQMDAAPAE